MEIHCRTFSLAESLVTHPAQAKIFDCFVRLATWGGGGNPAQRRGELPGKDNSALKLIDLEVRTRQKCS